MKAESSMTKTRVVMVGFSFRDALRRFLDDRSDQLGRPARTFSQLANLTPQKSSSINFAPMAVQEKTGFEAGQEAI